MSMTPPSAARTPPPAARGEGEVPLPMRQHGEVSPSSATEGSSLCQMRMDGRQNVIGVMQRIDVREAKHAEALAAKEVVASPVIVDLLAVLATIKLDNEIGLETGEVANEGPDAVLATKLEAGQAPGAQPLPDVALGVGRLEPHGSGVGKHGNRDGHGCRIVTGLTPPSAARTPPPASRGEDKDPLPMRQHGEVSPSSATGRRAGGEGSSLMGMR